MNIDNSTVSGNVANNGGGGFSNLSGAVSVNNSTFFNNSGGNGSGGAILNASGTSFLTNNTFTQNQSIGPVVANAGGSISMNNTIIGNSTTSCGGFVLSDEA